MVNVLKIEKIDLSNIEIERPESVSNYYYSKIKYGGEPLYIQTPKIINSKDMKHFDTSDPYVEVEVPINIYDIFSNLDDKILKSTSENWEKWMNKSIPIEQFEKMYNKITTPFKMEDIPKLKLKLPISRSKLLTKVFDENKVDCSINNLLEDCKIICILNLKGIKFNEKTFRCESYITQIKIFKKDIVEELDNGCLIDTEEDESIDENDIIDKQELEQLLRQDKIKMLINQKREEERLIQQINIRIGNLDTEINGLK
tara:strand:+ start:1867 stop:2637 length:771 start_codon:yes stop_codon:yes gene_type:complete